MTIFKKKTARQASNTISLNINNLKFLDMSKITTKNPILQRNGAKNSCKYSLSITYNYWLDGYAPEGDLGAVIVKKLLRYLLLLISVMFRLIRPIGLNADVFGLMLS
jgi:hypothetical protein